MKKIAFLSALVLIAISLSAQNGQAPLSKGDKQLNFGLGFNNYGLPLYVGADFAFHNDWTAGPVLKVVFDDDVRIEALGRVDYHWNRLLNIPPEWDVYLGASVGFLSGNNAGLVLGFHAGGRWYWDEKWGLNLEFGGGTGYGSSIGVSMKL